MTLYACQLLGQILFRFCFRHNFSACIKSARFTDFVRHFERMALRALNQIGNRKFPVGGVRTTGPGFGPFAFWDSHIDYLRIDLYM